MIDLFISIIAVLLFVIVILVGSFIYKYKDKKNYNFLNMFPFEMKGKYHSTNNLFYLLLTLVLGFTIFASLYIFYISEIIVLSKLLALSLMLCSLFIVSLFIIDFRNYQLHLLSSIVFATLNVINYGIFAYLGFRFAFTKYPLYSSIIAIVVCIILVVLLLLPSLKSWYLLKKNQADEFVRSKIHPYAFIEWINIILYFALFILATVSKILM